MPGSQNKRRQVDSQQINKRSASGNYPHYTVSKGEHTVTELGRDDLKLEHDFFGKYIAKRVPVKMKGYCLPLCLDGEELINSIDISRFQSESLEDTLQFVTPLQVEQKHAHGYGSGKKRVKLTLGQLLQKFHAGETDYYLTTQYAWDDPSFPAENADGFSDRCGSDSTQTSDNERHATPKDREVFNGTESDSDDGSDQISEFPGYRGSYVDNNDKEASANLGASDSIATNDEANSSDISSIIDMDNLRDDYVDSELDNEDDEDIVIQLHGISQSELDMRVSELLQPPLTRLINSSFPIVPELFQNLVPQQINLWLGCSSKTAAPLSSDAKLSPQSIGNYIPGLKSLSNQLLAGTSSGLHHDHADNLYIVLSGRKRFTLFSPENVYKLYTVGTVRKLYDSGVIDYINDANAPTWQPVRGDGAMIQQVLAWKLENNERKHTLSESELRRVEQEYESYINTSSNKPPIAHLDPPSFSKIPPALLHIDEFEDAHVRHQLTNMAQAYFPGLLEIPRLEVWVEPGESLYLPAGWFHEVSSFAGENANVHAALNYWFMPPTQADANSCYEDDYWPQDWERTRVCIEAIRKGDAQFVGNY